MSSIHDSFQEPIGSAVATTAVHTLEMTQPMIKQQPYPHLVQTIPITIPVDQVRIKTPKVHPKIAQFINQEVIVKMINNAFSSSGLLVSATNKLIVLHTVIGHNKNHQPIKDDLVIMMHNVASISRNPRDME